MKYQANLKGQPDSDLFDTLDDALSWSQGQKYVELRYGCRSGELFDSANGECVGYVVKSQPAEKGA